MASAGTPAPPDVTHSKGIIVAAAAAVLFVAPWPLLLVAASRVGAAVWGVAVSIASYVGDTFPARATTNLIMGIYNGDDSMSVQDGVALVFVSQIGSFIIGTFGPALVESFWASFVSRYKWHTTPFDDDLVLLVLSPDLDALEKELLSSVELHSIGQMAGLNQRSLGAISLSKTYNAPGALLAIQVSKEATCDKDYLNHSSRRRFPASVDTKSCPPEEWGGYLMSCRQRTPRAPPSHI